MQLGIFAKTFPGNDPASVLGAVAGAGFAVAQYNMACSGLPSMPDAVPPEIAAAVRAASGAAGGGRGARGGPGLEVTHAEDITPDVLPHAWKIFRLGPLIVPWRRLLRALGLTSEEKLHNARAIYHQYPTLKKGVWRYGAFCFTKPLAKPV